MLLFIIQNKSVKRKLESKKRIGQCHDRSVDLLLCYFENHRINTGEFLDSFEILDNFMDINLKAPLIFNKEILGAMKVNKDFFNNKLEKRKKY
ncbi:MAG: hypothetical protein J6J17_05165 [Bacilli bacterium]|nr:hypothetical protein [Bacilli bacterium]